MQHHHLHLCRKVHMSYQTVSDLPGGRSFQTVRETPPSFPPSPDKWEPDYGDAARRMLDRPYPVCMTCVYTSCMAQYKGRSMPKACKAVHANHLCKAFLLSLFPTSKMDCRMWRHAVSLNASGMMTQSILFWQQGSKRACSALLISLRKSVWKHSYCFLRAKSKSGHHRSLCDYSVEDLNRRGKRMIPGHHLAPHYLRSPWGCRILVLMLYFFSFHRSCYSLHCGGSRTTVSVERVCEASGSEWLWSRANWDGASAFTRCPVWNAQTVETAHGPCCNCGAHQLCSQPDGAEWLQRSYSRGSAKPELSSTLQPPQPSLIYFCFGCPYYDSQERTITPVLFCLPFPIPSYLSNTPQLGLLETAGDLCWRKAEVCFSTTM